jgi:hypothetical protein
MLGIFQKGFISSVIAIIFNLCISDPKNCPENIQSINRSWLRGAFLV